MKYFAQLFEPPPTGLGFHLFTHSYVFIIYFYFFLTFLRRIKPPFASYGILRMAYLSGFLPICTFSLFRFVQSWLWVSHFYVSFSSWQKKKIVKNVYYSFSCLLLMKRFHPMLSNDEYHVSSATCPID